MIILQLVSFNFWLLTNHCQYIQPWSDVTNGYGFLARLAIAVFNYLNFLLFSMLFVSYRFLFRNKFTFYMACHYMGTKGSKGEPASSTQTEQNLQPYVYKLLGQHLVSSEFQSQYRGPKGEPGSVTECKCASGDENVQSRSNGEPRRPGKDGLGMDRIVNYGYGAIVMKTRDDIDEVGHFLSPGSIVLILNQEEGSTVNQAPTMMIKITDQPNVWRQLNMNFGAEEYLQMSNSYKKIRKPIPNPVNMVYTDTKIYFVLLPGPWRGNIRIDEAHSMCQKYAVDSGLHGVFQAFLENQVRSLKSMVAEKYWYSYPIVNKNDEILFYSWSQMFNGYSKRNGVPLLTFEGHDILDIEPWRSKYMWVGGVTDIYRESVPSCRDWMSSAPTEFGMTINLQTSQFLNKLIKRPCGNAYYIGCIRISPDFNKKTL